MIAEARRLAEHLDLIAQGQTGSRDDTGSVETMFDAAAMLGRLADALEGLPASPKRAGLPASPKRFDREAEVEEAIAREREAFVVDL